MKYLLCFFLTIVTAKSYSQLTLSEMISVYKMNSDQFESFALTKGYKFSGIKDDECCFSVSYVKGNGVKTKYIELYTRFFNHGINVTFQTAIESELLSIKNQTIKSGFKLASTENFDGSFRRTYKKDNWVLTIYSGLDDDNQSFYEINLRKER
jgi:hypothetical protein